MVQLVLVPKYDLHGRIDKDFRNAVSLSSLMVNINLNCDWFTIMIWARDLSHDLSYDVAYNLYPS